MPPLRTASNPSWLHTILARVEKANLYTVPRPPGGPPAPPTGSACELLRLNGLRKLSVGQSIAG